MDHTETLGQRTLTLHSHDDGAILKARIEGDSSLWAEFDPSVPRGRMRGKGLTPNDDVWENGAHRYWFGDDDHGAWQSDAKPFALFVAYALKLMRRHLVHVARPVDLREAFAYIAKHDLVEPNVYGSAVEEVVARYVKAADDAGRAACRTYLQSKGTAALERFRL